MPIDPGPTAPHRLTRRTFLAGSLRRSDGYGASTLARTWIDK